MSVIVYEQMIKESAKQLLEWEQQQGKAYLRDRMRFLRLLKTGQCTSQAQAGALLGLSQRAAASACGNVTVKAASRRYLPIPTRANPVA